MEKAKQSPSRLDRQRGLLLLRLVSLAQDRNDERVCHDDLELCLCDLHLQYHSQIPANIDNLPDAKGIKEIGFKGFGIDNAQDLIGLV